MMRYQLKIDGKPAGQKRDTIAAAALDALDSGYAYPDEQGRIVLHDQADIVTIQPRAN